MKIISLLKRFRRKLLDLLKTREFLDEGLTRVPAVKGAVISDLFIWRKTEDWKTFFELLDVNNLINADHEHSGSDYATFIFYDSAGQEMIRKEVKTRAGRQTIDINALVPETSDGFGTYACFHSGVSEAILESGSFIAERGYSGYEWKNLGARGYVHGNLDAIAKSDKGIEMLGTFWKEKLIYQLQHELTGPAIYELALVNPTNKKQEVEFIAKDRRLCTETSEIVKLPSRGSFVKTIDVQSGTVLQLAIHSKMYMARPVAFRLQAYSMDVFHG